LFELLKKKLEKFAEKVRGKVESAEAPVSEKVPKETVQEEAGPAKEEKAAKPEKAGGKEGPERTAGDEGKKRPEEKKQAEAKAPLAPKQEKPMRAEKKQEAPEETTIGTREAAQEPKEAKREETPVLAKIAPEEAEEVSLEETAAGTPAFSEEKRVLKAKVSIRGRLRAAITGSVELKEQDLKGLLWELELALLEADVEQTTAEEICREIRQRLTGQKIPGGKKSEGFVKKQVSEILASMMQAGEIDLVEEIRAKKEKPYKILFLGPNGAGKTTSIAKLTHYLQAKGLKAIWAAGDTFRAASMEQLEKHAERLGGIRVIKHQYGADPTAVAFDAVKAAQSKGIDAVLIDSAGRQETNRNLMGELEKISRVIKPDMKIYVGEAYTGQALLQQAREYDKMAGIDAFILSKIDCDSKGGTTISLLHKMHKPILFVGTGQEYKDLQKFTPEFVLKKIIG
jgi:fused signal recognition particle receptor